MAATNHTANYQLNQWVESDPVRREDFNADNLKIDTVLQTNRSPSGQLHGNYPLSRERQPAH